MDDILHGLNAAQRTAVTSPSAVLQVLAPPGSGKTKTLTARVAYLIADQHLLPWNIIICTFTVKAANEMKERIKNFVGEELSKQLKLGTFHSVALRYLKHYGQHIGLAKDFGIADTSDTKAILKRIIKKLGMQIEPGQALGRISSRKAKGETTIQGKAAKDVAAQEFQRLFDEYEQTLAASNLLDYDDILLRCCSLLRSHPQCVSNVEAVLIDEFQDTNNIQYDLMRLFAQHQNKVTIVGDPDQSIYGFRSAEIKNLSRMKENWPDTLAINLQENYRSSGAILHAAQNIIEQDASRLPKKLQATHSFGLRPVLRRLPSASAEADWLVSEIRRMQALSGNMLQPSDFAILLRSATLSRVIEAALGKAGMPYRMVGGTRFYDRIEVKLIVDYLRVIHHPENSEAVARIVNVPSRRVGEETVKKLRDEAQARDVSLWTLILDVAQGRGSVKTKISEPCRKGLSSFVNAILTGRKKVESFDVETPSIVDLINLIAQKISLQSHLKSKHSEDETYEARWGNVEELMAQAAEVTAPERLRELAEADGLPVVDGLEQRPETAQDVLSVFLSNIALTASAEKEAEMNGEKVQQITLSTIHAAKGLEWPVVFIPACYDGSIPHSRADDHDEERRLLYVGMTRAQALLYLSCPVKNSQREETAMSAFLTHEGASRFFEEHGPSLPTAAAASLAMTLSRECPSEATITELKRSLGRDEDNFWPLNGEEALEASASWPKGTSTTSFPGFSNARPAAWVNSGSVTMQHQQGFSTASATMSGFTSVADRYNEIMEQATLTKIDKRAEEREQSTQASKGKKRPIEGQGSIATFFAKRSRPTAEIAPASNAKFSSQPLRDVSGRAINNEPQLRPEQREVLASHKPRSQPMLSRPSARPEQENDKHVMFLSSSPERPASDEPADREEVDARPTLMRPATTFHTTSMGKAAPGQKKTLGVRRSVQGQWNATRRQG
ncbi:ATP-dependent DNA helicase [Lecanosticta acicola]|uniref:DNA 3'-5' helicase n=1 Tax=Lecanosticta acicola TaxID=111012 RepID=A0AAI9ED13_9PEZI|nr:ATP-dependent DNA helicase [Lecanosticta acicola]